MRKPLTRIKKVASVSFLFFHEPLAKHVRILHGFLDFHFEGFLSIEMKVIFDNFDQKSSFFTFFTRVSGFRSKMTSDFHKTSLKMTFSCFFHQTLLKSLRDWHSSGPELHFCDSKITLLHLFSIPTNFVCWDAVLLKRESERERVAEPLPPPLGC